MSCRSIFLLTFLLCESAQSLSPIVQHTRSYQEGDP
jgi:hypothetical protein